MKQLYATILLGALGSATQDLAQKHRERYKNRTFDAVMIEFGRGRRLEKGSPRRSSGARGRDMCVEAVSGVVARSRRYTYTYRDRLAQPEGAAE